MRRLWRCAIPTNPSPVIFGGGVSSGPRIYSVEPTDGPDTGGTSVTIRGQKFTTDGTHTDITDVKFDATSAASFAVIDDFTIVATTAAGAGTVGVQVLSPRGNFTKANAYKFDSSGFDPTSLSWTGFYINYAGTPWAGTPTAGSSGSNPINSGVPAPTVGTQNGHGIADFDGASESLVTAGDLSTFSNPAHWSLDIVFKTNTVIAGEAEPIQYSDPCLWVNGDGIWGCSHTTLGIRVWMFDGVSGTGGYVVVVAGPDPGAGVWCHVQAYYDGTNVHARLNGGPWQSAACGNGWGGETTADPNHVGSQYTGGAPFYDGSIALIGASDIAFSTGDFDDIFAWSESYFGVTFAPFDPASLPLDWWQTPDYPGSGSAWPGTTSAGTSGTHSDASGSATTGTAVNGHIPLHSTGGTNSSGAETLDNYVQVAQFSGAITFNAATAPGDQGAGSRVLNAALMSADSGNCFGVTFSTAGVTFWILSSFVGYVEETFACSTGGWHCLQFKYDGSHITVRLDSGAWSTPAAVVSGFNGTALSGVHWKIGPSTFASQGPATFDLAEAFLSKSLLSDPDFDAYIGYLDTHYGLSL